MKNIVHFTGKITFDQRTFDAVKINQPTITPTGFAHQSLNQIQYEVNANAAVEIDTALSAIDPDKAVEFVKLLLECYVDRSEVIDLIDHANQQHKIIMCEWVDVLESMRSALQEV